MSVPWASPTTGTALAHCGDRLVGDDGEAFGREAGVWSLLRSDRRAALNRWSAAYARVRAAEQRRYTTAQYRRLPAVDPGDPLAELWRIRGVTFEAISQALAGQPLTVLDVGAGNGWTSARLQQHGHRPIAIDINLDDHDGLGALARHGVELPAARAEAAHLPLVDDSVDVVLFNASFHYCASQHRALEEAARVLRAGGRVVIADSPIFRHAASGRRMVAEQRSSLSALLAEGADDGGVAPELEGSGFLDHRDVRSGWSGRLATSVRRPHYGWRWALRRIGGAARTRREPAQFRLIVGKPALEEQR